MGIGFIVLFLLLVTGENSLATSQPSLPSSLPANPEPIVHAFVPRVGSSYSAAITVLGQQYMDALLHQKYASMWSMLHPQMQAMWPEQKVFASYLQMRFGNYNLQHFSFGAVSQFSTWVNPETMVEYNNVGIMPISLQLVSRSGTSFRTRCATRFRGGEEAKALTFASCSTG